MEWVGWQEKVVVWGSWRLEAERGWKRVVSMAVGFEVDWSVKWENQQVDKGEQ